MAFSKGRDLSESNESRRSYCQGLQDDRVIHPEHLGQITQGGSSTHLMGV